MLTNYKGKFGLRYNKILNSLVTQPNSGVISRFIYRTEIHKKKRIKFCTGIHLMIFHIKFTYDISLEYHINITCYYKTHLTVINDFEALCSNVIHVFILDVINTC